MLSIEAREDLQTDCSFEEIQRISQSLKKIKSWKVLSKEQVGNFIETQLFSQYTANV